MTVATREFKLMSRNGRAHTFMIWVESPVAHGRKNVHWRCIASMRLLGCTSSVSFGGVDAMQALQLALKHTDLVLFLVRRRFGDRLLLFE